MKTRNSKHTGEVRHFEIYITPQLACVVRYENKIYRNTNNTISIIITNVDPAVAKELPATTSRGNAIATARRTAAIHLDDSTSHALNAELVVQLSQEMQDVIADIGTSVS
jgi:hypothetical protein